MLTLNLTRSFANSIALFDRLSQLWPTATQEMVGANTDDEVEMSKKFVKGNNCNQNNPPSLIW